MHLSGRLKRVLLVGPYGGTNLGDDAILTCILAELRSAGVQVIISCSSPLMVASRTGLPTVPLLDYRRWERSALDVINSVDAVIIGGGQQLSQPRVPNPFWGHLARTCHMARWAWAQGKPTVLWAVGLDWPLSGISRWMVKRWLGTELVTLLMRDASSYRRMKALLAGRPAVVGRVADVAFLLPKYDGKKGRNFLCRELGDKDEGQYYAILSPAYDNVSEMGYLSALIDVGVYLARQGVRVVGWHSDLQPGYDMRLRAIRDWSRIPGFRWVPPKAYSTEYTAAMLGGAALLITARLHPAIIAAGQGTRVIGISRSNKMTEILLDAAVPQVGPNCGTRELLVLAQEALEGLHSPNVQALERQRQIAKSGSKLTLGALGISLDD